MALLIRTLAAAAVALPLAASAGTGVTITSYGHSALLIQGGGAKVLINPFKAVACAAGLTEPKVNANVILASSLLLDEGAPVASGKFLSQPGSYRLAGLKIEGISAPHDRLADAGSDKPPSGAGAKGHLCPPGGHGRQLSPEDRVLLGNPDVLIVGVGGGAKVYDGVEAAAVVRELAPKRVIPVQYVSGKTPANCDQSSVEPFLEAMKGTNVKRVGRVLSLPGSARAPKSI